MNQEQREIIRKLNEDNKKLNRMHDTMVEYANYKLVLGILVVIVLLLLYFV